jgi:RimJ/RimL family protein N-acetyltransferase
MQNTTLKAGETDPWARSLAFQGVLRHGRRVRIRPISSGDKSRIATALLNMSARSRYLRFHEYRTGLTDAELRYLTELDYRRHVAWGALAPDEPGRPGVGVARFIRDPERPDAAEFAITVVDDWQGVGLGKLLLQTLLVSAAEYGIERLVAHVLEENTPALRLFRHVGARTVAQEGGSLVLEVPVSSAIRRPRASEARLSRVVVDASAG